MPPRPAVTVTGFDVSEARTTHVQAISIVHIVGDTSVIKAAQSTSIGHDSIIESCNAITQSISRSPAPEATGVVFELYTSSGTTLPDESGTPNHGAIIGGILGGLAFLVLCLILITLRRNKSRYQQRPAPKKGSWRQTHLSTNDAINEAHRRRNERNLRDHERRVHGSPHCLTPADMAEMVHQGNVMAAEQHSERSLGKVAKYPSRPVAVAVPGAGRARSTRSDRPDSASLPSRDAFDEVDLSMK